MRMKKIVLLSSLSAFLFLAACQQVTAVDTTAIAAQVGTAIAETIAAMPSATPEPTLTPSLTPTATETATSTPSPTVALTSSATIGAAYVPATVAPQNICDNAAFVEDVTIPDGTQLAPGAAFTKTWRVRNTGTCAWGADYAIIFSSGNQMSGVSPQKLTGKNVAAGQALEITVNFVAPAQAGSYTSYWQMRNAANAAFGQAFYVQIKVTGGTVTSTTTPSSTATLVATSIPTTAATATATETPTETATP